MSSSGDGRGASMLGNTTGGSAPVAPEEMVQEAPKGVLKRGSVDQRFPDFHVPVNHRHLVK